MDRHTAGGVEERLGQPDILVQLAEECSELAQVALKLQRCLEGRNPVRRTQKWLEIALVEEAADVLLSMRHIPLIRDQKTTIDAFMAEKDKRWLKSLEERDEN